MTITLTREEAQQVLEILHYLEALNSDTERQKMQAIETLRARLALHDMNQVAEQNGEKL